MAITPKEIILQEHNSSRLIFVDWGPISNNELILYIKNTTKDPGSTAQYADNCDCTGEVDNPWLLGRLTANIWLLEDVGIYDSNHEHTAKIYYIDPNTNEEVVMYNVKRTMEWSEECDRLYVEEGGGTKMRFIINNNLDQNVKFFLKYEKSLAGTNEKVVQTKNGVYGIEFYKRYGDLYGITSLGIIKNNLLVTKDEIDSDGNLIPLDNINYCNLNIQDVSIDFSSLNINYTLDENNTNDIKIGIISVETGKTITNNGELSGENKFVSSSLVNSNACMNPSYFIVQPPQNRSWICYRFIYDYGLFGLYYSSRTMPNNAKCAVLNIKGNGYPAGGLTGMYGEYKNNVNNSTYRYEIGIGEYTGYKPTFHLLLPAMYTNYKTIVYMDKNDEITVYTGNPPFTIYNELDGIYYRVYSIPPSSPIHKIILIYDA